jgi:hypothetical protein
MPSLSLSKLTKRDFEEKLYFQVIVVSMDNPGKLTNKR